MALPLLAKLGHRRENFCHQRSKVNLWLSSSGELTPFAGVVAKLENTFPGISIRRCHSEKRTRGRGGTQSGLHRGKAPWIYLYR